MGAGVFYLLVFVLVVGYYYHSNHKKFEKEIARINGLDIERKKLELMKLQTKIDSKKTNHILHLLLCVFTLGIWSVAWFLIAQSNASERKQLEKLVESI